MKWKSEFIVILIIIIGIPLILWMNHGRNCKIWEIPTEEFWCDSTQNITYYFGHHCNRNCSELFKIVQEYCENDCLDEQCGGQLHNIACDGNGNMAKDICKDKCEIYE